MYRRAASGEPALDTLGKRPWLVLTFMPRYDDGGYSGGSTERPALQRLLADVRAREVDVIVVGRDLSEASELGA